MLDRCAHLVRTNQSVKVFSQVFFKKLAGYQGRALRRPPQRAKYLYRSQNAGEGEFLCDAKKEGEPSSGVLLFWLVCVKDLFCYLFEKR